MALKIFFSHTWADKVGANLKILVNALKDSKDHNIWIDRYEMDVSEHIEASVEAAIKSSDVIIVAWSKNASRNKNVEFELKSARNFKKPIVPCIIDGFATTGSKLVAGLKSIKIKGDQKHDIPQLTFLNDYLIKIALNKLDASIDDEETKEQIQELKEKHLSSSNLLKELEDIHHRQKLGVSGNESSDIYVQSALKEAINLSSTASNEKIQEFFQRMMEATLKFPGLENDRKKVEYLLQTINDLDPDRSDTEFQEFCQRSLSSFATMSGNSDNDDVGKEQVEASNEDAPSGNYYDNNWFGVRLYINDGSIQETYANGCKVYFPGIGTATIYFLYSFHEDLNAIGDFLNACLRRMQSQGTQVQTAANLDIGKRSVALEMAYHTNDGQPQYEYLGGYCVDNDRGFLMEIIANEEPVTSLFRKLFVDNIYLLNDQEPGGKNDEKLFGHLSNRKLLSISSSSSGYGSFYSSSSDQKHFRLHDSGEFSYYYRATNYSSGMGGLNNESTGFGRWGVYAENSQYYMWFKWNEGQYELCEMRFGNDSDLYLGKAKYFIVSLDYQV